MAHKTWACRVFGCRPRRTVHDEPPYGTVHGGNVDGIGREHYRLYIPCSFCDTPVEVGKFHGPLGHGVREGTHGQDA